MLNNDKTEVMVFGPRAHRDSISKTLVSQGLQCTHEARNLGVIFDSDLNFSKHFTKITKSAITQIRNIAKIRSFLSFSDAEILIHAFVSSHLDYCNSLFAELPLKSINHLQLVQNTVARVLTRARKYDHISPVLASLHWLPVVFRIDFKSLNGLAPSYITNLLITDISSFS